jgi:phage shock protein PspC (stress-responsive transcriptional regulator)
MQRLYRSRSDALLGGVCGGIAEHLGVDPTLVRVVFAVLAVVSGIGILIYLLLWLIVPLEGVAQPSPREAVRAGAEEIADRAQELGQEVRTAVAQREIGFAFVVAAILIFLGVSLLLRNLGFWWAWWLGFDVLWPIALIVVGLALLWRLGGRRQG